LGGKAIQKIEREVTGVAGTDMRCDFLLTHTDSSKTVIEVKTVVDTDYDPKTAPKRPGCVFVGRGDPYRRCAIFPWGKSNQVGPEGEKVVSARAIKHIRELAKIALRKKHDVNCSRISAAILFVVVRGDALAFRPNADACPSFARYLREARDAGVRILARQVRWGEESEGEELGTAIDEGNLPIVLG